jgi:phospholipase/carboxylesterase
MSEITRQSDAPLVHLVRPAPENEPEPRPALLLLHGRGADEVDLFGLADALDPRLVVISARAPFRLGPGYHWYELVDIGRPEPETFAAGFGLLRDFVEHVIERYAIDPARLYLLGFSQGAMMTGAYILAQPSRVAGAIVLSGYLPLNAGLSNNAAGLRGKPFFVAHGTQDPVIPIAFGRQTRDYLEQAGAELTYREYPMAHFVSEVELEDLADWLAAHLDAAPDANPTPPE